MALTDTLRQGLGGGNNTPAIKELQGLNVDLLAGTTADTKVDVAAIRSADTIISAIHLTAGAAAADLTSTMSINTLEASGTLTFVSAVDTDVFVVNDVTYTISTAGGSSYQEIEVGASDTLMADAAVAAINGHEGSFDGADAVVATNEAGVVTITAKVPGAAGNAITISSVDTTITASDTVLAGGSDTGGVQSTTDTSSDQILLFWYDKA